MLGQLIQVSKSTLSYTDPIAKIADPVMYNGWYVR